MVLDKEHLEFEFFKTNFANILFNSRFINKAAQDLLHISYTSYNIGPPLSWGPQKNCRASNYYIDYHNEKVSGIQFF